ncbi:MAG: type II toxin-antitoxin system Phd/YefM family antitoxin [Chloroflexia bacterium]|nr:type II toxin-antitoxin system Phd/YefM family antitoxin [Chloroflexia bacterium]
MTTGLSIILPFRLTTPEPLFAASSLAALIKRSRANHQPIIVTQKGYPTGVILDVDLFTALRELADIHLEGETVEGAADPDAGEE